MRSAFVQIVTHTGCNDKNKYISIYLSSELAALLPLYFSYSFSACSVNL